MASGKTERDEPWRPSMEGPDGSFDHSSRWSQAYLNRLSLAPPSFPERHGLVLPLCLLHAAVMVAWSLFRHHNFASTSDLGAYHAVFWNLSYRSTAWNSIDRIHQWSTHIELGLLWLVVPYRLHTSPIWLFLTQSLACALAALPIDAVARRVTRDPVIGLLAALSMLLTPQLLLGEINDFHPIVVCALPMAVVAWGIEADDPKAITLGAVFALSIREHMGLLLVAASVAWVIRAGKRRLFSAIALGVFSLTAFLLAVTVLIPAFGSGSSFRDVAQYQRLGGSTEAALRTFASNPVALLTMTFEGDRKLFLLDLGSGGLPLLFLSLRSLRRAAWPLLLTAPLLGAQLLSDDPMWWDIRSPHAVPVVPLFAVASVLALVFLPGAVDQAPGAPLLRALSYRRLAAVVWLALGIAHVIQVVPSPIGPGGPIDFAFAGSPREAALRRALSWVPPDASISAQDDVVPHVATREEVHQWPDGEATDDFILLDQDGLARNVASPAELAKAAARLRRDRRFRILLDEEGVLLLKRIDLRAGSGKERNVNPDLLTAPRR
jgi:uncharacterized membrane protein